MEGYVEEILLVLVTRWTDACMQTCSCTHVYTPHFPVPLYGYIWGLLHVCFNWRLAICINSEQDKHMNTTVHTQNFQCHGSYTLRLSIMSQKAMSPELL